jgi:hypothetical protein
MNEHPSPISLTVAAPFHKESAHVARFLARLEAVLARMDAAWTVICVNDGSTDDTLALLLVALERETRIKVIDLSRNFGKGKPTGAIGEADYFGRAGSPAECSVVSRALARRWRALPGRSGFCWESSGAQPVRKMSWKRAGIRPFASAWRSA